MPLKGLVEMQVKLRKLAAMVPERVGAALYQEMEIEATEAKKRTPVRYGALKASIHVEGPTFEGKSIYARIVAGGPSAPYAIFVHENLEAFHRVGQAKFVESVLLESRPYLAARIARRLKLSEML